VIKDGVNGFVIGKKNYQELAQRCSQLLKDGELRKELGERGRKIVEEGFTDERMVKDTLRVYEETISGYTARKEERKHHPVLA